MIYLPYKVLFLGLIFAASFVYFVFITNAYNTVGTMEMTYRQSYHIAEKIFCGKKTLN